MSSGMTTAGTGQPGLRTEYVARFHSIHARQSCGADGTGEPTGGGGEVGGGGELRLLRTEEAEGEGEGTRVEAADCIAAALASRHLM